MDQKALDDAYDQDVYAPNRPLIVTRRIAAAERARAILGEPERVAYGPSEYERLDIFRSDVPNAPINVFIHGGAWRRNKGPDYHALAEPLVRAGAHCVILDFINVEQANGDLMPMYEQVRRAIAWTWRNADSFGGDRDRLYISAHSSGSHLAACVLTDGWREEGLPQDFCKGALLLSGMYDLEPVPLSKRSLLCEVHRRDGGEAHRRSGISTACTRRSFSPTAPARRRNSSARPTNSSPPCAHWASRSS